eukprot:5931995-Amphidinium_carterae.1
MTCEERVAIEVQEAETHGLWGKSDKGCRVSDSWNCWDGSKTEDLPPPLPNPKFWHHFGDMFSETLGLGSGRGRSS